MFIHRLTLKNFRNYIEECVSFKDGVNILTGSNAQGKTNSAEAIFFLCTGYSPRAQRDKQVIRYGEKQAKAQLALFVVRKRGERASRLYRLLPPT
jgi:DNA replication and repair protein RecF